ncbi:MAG: hypothetical protein ACYDHH_13455 [Solirubrobacteraceae bacterium]
MSRKLIVIGTVLAIAALIPASALASGSPVITNVSASGPGVNSIALHGEVNPNGSATHYYFQWGLTTGYGSNGTLASAGSGTKPVHVSFEATGLIPGTVYHYRLVAQSALGQSVSADEMFKTGGQPPPTLATGPAIAVTRNTATLTGVVNPNNQVTDYQFQYGVSPAYGATTNLGTVPAGPAAVNVAMAISGLQPGAVFHFRIIAFHADSPIEYGADQTMLTQPDPAPLPGMTVVNTPRQARRAPFTLTTLGKLSGPSWIPAPLACSGAVRITVLDGKRRLSSTTTPVQGNCTFALTTQIGRLPAPKKHRHGKRRHGPVRLTVETFYQGNGYLAPRKGRNQTVTVKRS